MHTWGLPETSSHSCVKKELTDAARAAPQCKSVGKQKVLALSFASRLQWYPPCSQRVALVSLRSPTCSPCAPLLRIRGCTEIGLPRLWRWTHLDLPLPQQHSTTPYRGADRDLTIRMALLCSRALLLFTPKLDGHTLHMRGSQCARPIGTLAQSVPDATEGHLISGTSHPLPVSHFPNQRCSRLSSRGRRWLAAR